MEIYVSIYKHYIQGKLPITPPIERQKVVDAKNGRYKKMCKTNKKFKVDVIWDYYFITSRKLVTTELAAQNAGRSKGRSLQKPAIIENWPLQRDGRYGELAATELVAKGSSTVYVHVNKL